MAQTRRRRRLGMTFKAIDKIKQTLFEIGHITLSITVIETSGSFTIISDNNGFRIFAPTKLSLPKSGLTTLKAFTLPHTF